MCDTTVALSNSTSTGEVLFAKNSDRDPNEAQQVELFAAQDHPQPSKLKCTYIEIPQVPHTYQVLLSKPFWIWGAEMGANEFGVVIGNEAVFTKIPHEKSPGLIGMDFLRLGLERGKTAFEALQVITQLLAEYGQSGNCGFAHPFQYHNSFLIADPQEAWVLETAGREWAAEKVKSIRSISNAITIGGYFDLASKNLVKQAVDKGWCKSEKDFDFGRCYSDFIYTTFCDGHSRQACTSGILQQSEKKLSIEQMMDMLQNHKSAHQPDWSPDKALTGADVCMHFAFGPIRISQTTGSMVSSITPDRQIHWVTGTAAPCLGLFKPIWMDAGLPDHGQQPTGIYQPDSMWWEHEELHRAVLQDYSTRRAAYIEQRDHLQNEMRQAVEKIMDGSPEDRLTISSDGFTRSRTFTRDWYQLVKTLPIGKKAGRLYTYAWRKINGEAKYV